MQVTIATAPCSWGVWYADGTPSKTPWNVFLDQAQQAGYKALELGPDGYLPTDVGELRETLAAHELAVCAGTACYQFDTYRTFADFRDRIDALCARIAAVGGQYLVTMDESDVGAFSEKKADLTKDDWARFFTMLRELGRFSFEQHGIRTVWHPHVKTMIETEAEIEQLMEETGLDLCLDLGHHAYTNGGTAHGDQSAIDFLRKWTHKTPYLHFKNVDGAVRRRLLDEHLSHDDAFDLDVMCDLADGIIDYTDVKRLLEQLDFRGIGVIEQDVPNATTDEAFEIAKRNLNYLRDIALI